MTLLKSLLFASGMLAAGAVVAQKKGNTSIAAPYLQYIDDNMDAHLKEFLAFVSIPSISSLPDNKPEVAKAAAWIQTKMKAIGLTQAELLPTASNGNPVVFGAWTKAPGKPTVLIYAHYDVQPVNPAEWVHPPFEPLIEDGKIYGRGASDDKSGIMVVLCAVEAMLKKDGKLPVNVKFMFEGEEELGSTHFRQFLTDNAGLLKADYALNADDGQFGEETPSMTLSLRGAVPMEFTVKTAEVDGHSGEFGGKTPNADVILAQIISSFYDEKGNVAVEGFYKDVLPITEQQKAMVRKIPYDPAKDMKILGTIGEVGDTSFLPLERTWYRPTLEIIGMQGGYVAKEGHSNIIPGKAMARITCRLVNNQKAPDVIESIVQHIKKHCPAYATVSFKLSDGYASPFSLPTDTKAFQYVSTVLTDIYGKEPLQTATGGSVGAMLSLKEVLGLSAYPLGFQLKDEKWHAANEFYRLASFRKGQIAYCHYLQLLGRENSKSKK